MTAPAPVRPRPVARAGRPPGRAALLARLLRTEFRRGGGVPTAALTAALSAVLLVDQREYWAGRLPVLVTWQRSDLAVVGALVAAIAVWHAQRERRMATEPLLASTARAPWHRVVLGWAAVTAGALLGYVVAFGLGAATVAAGPALWIGGWELSFATGAVSIGALAAAGTMVGRSVTHRLAAPVTAVVVFFGTLFTGESPTADGRPTWLLSPAVQQLDNSTDRLGAGTILLQAAWFATAAVALLALAAARPRVRAVPAVLVAAAAGVGLVAGAPDDPWVHGDDPAAQVCTGEAPRVCVHRFDAFLLPEVDREVRGVFGRVAGAPDLPPLVGQPVAATADEGASVDDAVLELPPTLSATLGGRLADVPTVRYWVLAELLYRDTCSAGGTTEDGPEQWFATASALVVADDDGAYSKWQAPADQMQLAAAMRRLDPAARDETLVAYLIAAHTCDEAALDALRARMGAA